MIGKSYKINGNTISKTTGDYQVGLTMVNWRKVNVTNEKTNITGSLGVRVSPTYPRERLITIEGVIIADTRTGLSKAIDYLDNLFAIDYTKTNNLEFGIIDEQDREWKTQVTIKDSLEYEINDDDYLDGANRTFRISLISEDPRMFSNIENTVEGIESSYGGAKLGVKLGTKLNTWSNTITCITSGNIASPVKFEITVKRDIPLLINDLVNELWTYDMIVNDLNKMKKINKPLTILNINTKEFFKINDDFKYGDKLIIDTKKYSIEKNGISIKDKKIVGSTWLQVKGVTKFAIYDLDGGLISNDLEVKIYFNNVLL